MSGTVLDAVVIGAGHNGLVAAAYLARAGLEVEVFERRDVVGGACVTEELWPGVRASPGAYTLSLLRAEIIRDLDLAAHGLHVDVHEPYLFAPFPTGGRSSPGPRGSGPTPSSSGTGRARTPTAMPSGASAGSEPPLERGRSCSSRPTAQRWLEAIGPELLDGSIADQLAGMPSEAVRVPFAIQGLIGTLAGPEDPGTAFVAFYHQLGEAAGTPGAWGFARGGMGAVTAALRSAAEAAGARVHVEAPVERVVVEEERARGVVLEGGRELRAAAVLSNADPRRTAALAGLPEPEGWRQEGPVVKVMLLLDGLPDFPAWPGPEPWAGTIDIGFTLADLAAAAADARAGRPAARPWIEAACQTAADPTLAPPGRHVLSMFCQCFPPDADADAAADAAIARFAEVCPQLPDRIVDRLALGPRELEARFGLTGGHIFHGEMLRRPAARAPLRGAAFRWRRGPLPRRLGRSSRRRGDGRPGIPRGARRARGPR